MNEFLPIIREAEYADFLAIKGVAEPPAILGLPPTFADWLARHRSTKERFEIRDHKVIMVEVSVAEFRDYIGGRTDASVHDLWQCARELGRPDPPTRPSVNME